MKATRLDFTRWRGLAGGFIPPALRGIDLEAGRIDALDGEGRAVSFHRSPSGEWKWEETHKGETHKGRVADTRNLETSARRLSGQWEPAFTRRG